MKELRSLYQGLPMARQALDKGDITGAKEILREMDRYLQDVLWTTVTMPQDPGGAPASDAAPAPKRSGNDQPKQGEDGDHRERHERLPSVQSKMLARAHDALLAYGPQSQRLAAPRRSRRHHKSDA